MKKLLQKTTSIATGLLMLGTLATNAQERTLNYSLSGANTVAVGSSVILTVNLAITENDDLVMRSMCDGMIDPLHMGHGEDVHCTITYLNATQVTVTGVSAGSDLDLDVHMYPSGFTAFPFSVTAAPGAVAQTNLVTTSCGAVAQLSTNLFAKGVTGATSYTFKFVNNSTSAVIETASPYNYINGTKAGCAYGTAYTVYVKATTPEGMGEYKATGCTVTYSSMPNTQLTSTYCNQSLASVKTRIFCKAVSGATGYDWLFTGATVPGGTVTKHTSSNFTSPYNAGCTNNAPGSISVAVKATGGNYSNSCNLFIGGSERLNGGNNGEITLNVFPNPSKGEVNLTTNVYGNYDVINKYGQTIKTITLNEENEGSQSINDLKSGMYYIVNQEDRSISKKVLIEKE